MDVGTLPWADGEYRYFLLVVDLFSHLVETIPLRDQTAKSIVNAFLGGWVYRGHGVPIILVTDQGKNVDGAAIHELCQELGIQKRHTTPYHPEADGMAERHIGFVKQVIRCLMLERNLEKGSWPSLLPEVTFYCNNLDNASTKISPHLMTFGRQPRTPLDMLIAHAPTDGGQTGNEYVDLLLKKREELDEIAQKNRGNRQLETKERYDAGKKISGVASGDLVFVKKEQRGDSLDVRFEGPFRVLDRRGVIVQIEVGSRNKWIHLNRCKPYVPQVITRPIEPADQGVEALDSGEGDERESPCLAGTEVAGLEADTDIEDEGETAANRRYPSRNRKPKVYEGFIPWKDVPTWRVGYDRTDHS